MQGYGSGPLPEDHPPVSGQRETVVPGVRVQVLAIYHNGTIWTADARVGESAPSSTTSPQCLHAWESKCTACPQGSECAKQHAGGLAVQHGCHGSGLLPHVVPGVADNH